MEPRGKVRLASNTSTATPAEGHVGGVWIDYVRPALPNITPTKSEAKTRENYTNEVLVVITVEMCLSAMVWSRREEA